MSNIAETNSGSFTNLPTHEELIKLMLESAEIDYEYEASDNNGYSLLLDNGVTFHMNGNGELEKITN